MERRRACGGGCAAGLCMVAGSTVTMLCGYKVCEEAGNRMAGDGRLAQRAYCISMHGRSAARVGSIRRARPGTTVRERTYTVRTPGACPLFAPGRLSGVSSAGGRAASTLATRASSCAADDGESERGQMPIGAHCACPVHTEYSILDSAAQSGTRAPPTPERWRRRRSTQGRSVRPGRCRATTLIARKRAIISATARLVDGEREKRRHSDATRRHPLYTPSEGGAGAVPARHMRPMAADPGRDNAQYAQRTAHGRARLPHLP